MFTGGLCALRGQRGGAACSPVRSFSFFKKLMYRMYVCVLCICRLSRSGCEFACVIALQSLCMQCMHTYSYIYVCSVCIHTRIFRVCTQCMYAVYEYVCSVCIYTRIFTRMYTHDYMHHIHVCGFCIRGSSRRVCVFGCGCVLRMSMDVFSCTYTYV